MDKVRLSNYLLIILIVVVALLVLYLSWTSSPKIGNINIVPGFISTWVDTYMFQTIRTAVPLFFLGLFLGLFLIVKNLTLKYWVISWILLLLLVVLAEVGQFFRPHRVFDKGDIKWGWFGATMGLIGGYFIFYLYKIFKKSYSNNIS